MFEWWRYMEPTDSPRFYTFEEYAELAKRINAMKLQMERDIIYGNTRSEPMDRETFERIWGEQEGGEDE